MTKLTTERLEKRIKNCIEVGNGCVMLPVSVAEELLAYRKTVNHLLDNDGSRGKFSAVQSYDAREDLERLLAVAQQNEPQNIPDNIPAQPVSNPYKLNSWISVADRLPSGFGRYLCYVEEQNDLGKSHYQWNCSWNGDVFSDSSLTGRITHWMPLPEPPAQESE